MAGGTRSGGLRQRVFVCARSGKAHPKAFYVANIDAKYAQVATAAYMPTPRHGTLYRGERYFHVADPAGYELSFIHPPR